MTYQHALRYMTQSSSSAEHKMSLSRLASHVAKGEPSLILISFSNDNIGDAAANVLESILTQANIPTLRWVDDSTVEPKKRYTLNTKPLSPPLLAQIGGDVQSLERSLRSSAEEILDTSDRSTAVLAQYAKMCDVRVLLIQTDLHHSHASRFETFFPRLQEVCVLSQSNELSPGTIRQGTREIISLPCGPAMFHLISDVCANNGSRFTITPKFNKQASSGQSLGAQTLQYRALPPCRIFSCAPSMAQALSLSLECALSLRRMGLTLADHAIAAGAERAAVAPSGTVISIHPLIVANRARHADELRLTLEDVTSGDLPFPFPRRLCLDPSLVQNGMSLPDFFDEWWDATQAISDKTEGTWMLIGSDAFIETAKKRLKTNKKA